MNFYLETLKHFKIEQRSKYSKIKYKNTIDEEISEIDFYKNNPYINRCYIEKILNDNILDYDNTLEWIKKISLPDNIKYIQDNTFSSSILLENISLLSIEKIGENAFAGCRLLTQIELSEKIKLSLPGIFKECNSLKKINLPLSTTRIPSLTFFNCIRLEEVYMYDNVEYIDKEAFKNCFSLKNINLSNELKYIEARAFSNCTSLEKIEIPSSIEYIAPSAFGACSHLKEIIFEDESYKEKPDLQSFIICYKDKIKIKDLDEIINDNSKKTKEINSKCMDELEK